MRFPLNHINWEKILANRYNHLLVALMILFVVSPSMELRRQTERFPVLVFILFLVLISGLRMNVSKGRTYWSFFILVVVALVLQLLVYYLPENQQSLIHVLSILTLLTHCLFFTILIYTMAARLFRIQEVSGDSIKGGICVYLLIGFLWAMFYVLLDRIDPNAFVAHSEMMYTYFSFTTLTTLGYGDIVPTSRFSAMLTNTEAIVGQCYLAIFIARLVGLHIAHELKG